MTHLIHGYTLGTVSVVTKHVSESTLTLGSIIWDVLIYGIFHCKLLVILVESVVTVVGGDSTGSRLSGFVSTYFLDAFSLSTDILGRSALFTLRMKMLWVRTMEWNPVTEQELAFVSKVYMWMMLALGSHPSPFWLPALAGPVLSVPEGHSTVEPQVRGQWLRGWLFLPPLQYVCLAPL